MEIARLLIHINWVLSMFLLVAIAGCENPIAERETNTRFREAIAAGDVEFAKTADGMTPLDWATLMDVVTEDDEAVIAMLRKAIKEVK